MSQGYKRIIVSRTDRIGDVVLSLPVFAAMKNCFPGIQTFALVTDYTADVARSSPRIDNVMTYDPNESIARTSKKLKAVGADAILVLFPRFKIAAASLLAGIPIRVGTAYRWYSFLFNKKVHEHRKMSVKNEADYNLSLVEALGCSERILDITLDTERSASDRIAAFLNENCLTNFIVVHPGSGGSAHDWSADSFREMIKSAADNLSQNIIVTGTEDERFLCKKVSEGISNAINTAGRFSMLEFMALVSKAGLFISNSTGPLHIAAAVGTPVIGLYPNKKPMTPVRWAPLTDKKIILTPGDGSDNLSMISVEEVLESIRQIIPSKRNE